MPNPNLYNGGSEWQSEFGNLPDYHQTFFRNYDPEIGRFTGADPKPESADGMTVYQYAGDDPVNMNDPMGDLLPIPGSHNPSFGPNVGGGFQTGLPSNLQQQQDAFFNGAGDSYNSTGTSDYTAQWNAILAGTGFSLGPNGAQYNESDDNGATISRGIVVYGKVPSTQSYAPLLIIYNDKVGFMPIFTNIPVPSKGMDPYMSPPIDPITIDANDVDLLGVGHDAGIITVGGDVISGPGWGLSWSLVHINTGDDAGGWFLYSNSDRFKGTPDISVYGEVGFIDFNYSSGASFDRYTFKGLSETYNGGFNAITGTIITAYTDGQSHVPYFNHATVLYWGMMSGFTYGLPQVIQFTASFGKSIATPIGFNINSK